MDAADDEIEALCSIWEGVHVEKHDSSRKVSHKIKSLEDEATSASLLLECLIPNGYPSVSPSVQLSNPRGIGEPEFRELCRQIEQRVQENSDEMPIICEIFQTCSDYLTEHQHTNMDCSICLRSLSESPIIVTSCDHFMHCSCFCKYLTECSKEFKKEIDEQKRTQPNVKCNVNTNILCPVCREFLTDHDSESVNFETEIRKMITESKRTQKTLMRKKRRSSTTGEDVQRTMKRWREEQLRLLKLFQRQRENGGIIDVEEDKKRRQFYIETRVESPTDPETSEDVFDTPQMEIEPDQ